MWCTLSSFSARDCGVKTSADPTGVNRYAAGGWQVNRLAVVALVVLLPLAGCEGTHDLTMEHSPSSSDVRQWPPSGPYLDVGLMRAKAELERAKAGVQRAEAERSRAETEDAVARERAEADLIRARADVLDKEAALAGAFGDAHRDDQTEVDLIRARADLERAYADRVRAETERARFESETGHTHGSHGESHFYPGQGGQECDSCFFGRMQLSQSACTFSVRATPESTAHAVIAEEHEALGCPGKLGD
jgi:hypothetical protein